MFSRVGLSNISWCLSRSSIQTPRGFCTSTAKAQEQFSCLNKGLEKRALDLIFGKKSYQNFTSDEKKLVNWYQDMILKEDGGVILPNTEVDWKQRQLEQLSLNEKR